MIKQLHISPDLSLPLEFVTTTQAVLAKRGVGKSYTAAVQAEEMLKAGQQVVIIDPTGAHWGLRSSADGRGEGFPILVAGGEHGDIPLEEHAGELIAAALVENRFSAVLDLSLFRKGQLTRFMGQFLEALYRLNRQAMHLFCDEADAFAPQRPFGDEARTLGAMEDVVRRGRLRGIGCTVITQRPAVLNKNVLTQCEVLCALRLVHPLDIKAVMEWVNVHAEPDKAQTMVDSLPSLPVGTAWFWSPSMDIFRRVKVRARETFNSGATPKAGETVKAPKVLAKVDIQQLGQAIAETAQKAKENDPKALKAELAKLRAELAKSQQAKPTAKVETKRVEVPVITNAQISRLEKLYDRAEARTTGAMERLAGVINPLSELLHGERTEVGKLLAAARAVANTPPPAVSPRPMPQRPVAAARHAPSNGDATSLKRPQLRILNAIAWWNMIGVAAPSRAQVGFVAGIKPTGGHFSNSIGPLTTGGYIDSVGDGVSLTAAGAEIAEAPEAAPTLDAYHASIRAVLKTGAQQRIFDVIIAHGMEGMRTEEIGERAGIDPAGGHFSNSIGPLSTLGLVDRRGGIVRPTELMFPPSLAT